MEEETTSGKPMAEAVKEEVVMEEETTSGKPLAEAVKAESIEGRQRIGVSYGGGNHIR